MLYRALNTVTHWQLRVKLLGCEGVKHAGMAKDMRVTTALLAVAPPVIRWKNYVVVRLDGFDDRSGHFRRQSKTVTKASGPSWNGEELVIDDDLDASPTIAPSSRSRSRDKKEKKEEKKEEPVKAETPKEEAKPKRRSKFDDGPATPAELRKREPRRSISWRFVRP